MSVKSLINRVSSKFQRLNASCRELRLALGETLGLKNSEFIKPGEKLMLMYHGIVSDRPSLFNWRHITREDFEVHLLLLSKYCVVVPVADFATHAPDSNKLTVALTFDDGFLNNLEYALPLLEKYKIPASFYVTGMNQCSEEWLWPDFVDIVSKYASDPVEVDGVLFIKRGKLYVEKDSDVPLGKFIKFHRTDYDFKLAVYEAFSRWQPNLFRPDYVDYWKLMDDEQIARVADSEYVTIGCHGYYHNNLGEIAEDKAVKELLNCKKYLEALTGKEVSELAYPDGSYSKSLLNEATQIGFTTQLALELLFSEAPDSVYPIRRAGVYSFEKSRSQLALLFKGSVKY